MKTIHNPVRFIFLLIGASFFLSPALAQTTNTGYFMKSQHSRTSFNPALRPEQGYVGMPILSNLYIGMNTNTLNLEHFIYPGSPKAKTFLHEDITVDQFLKGISDNNYLSTNLAWTLASVGFYKGSGFWTMDLGVRAFADVNIPYDVFQFAKQGLATSNGDPVDGYDLTNIRGTVTGYAELGLGYSHSLLDDKLLVGGKAKILFGLADMNLHLKRLTMNTGKDKWTIESEAVLEASLLGLKPQFDENGRLSGLEHAGPVGLGGFGLGFDLGASYKLSGIKENEILDRFTVSAALTDIGFIGWSNKSSMSIATRPTTTVITGDYNINFSGEGESLGDQLSAIGDKLMEIIDLADIRENTSRSTALRMNMNLGVEYEVIENKFLLGMLSTTRFNPSCNVTEFTLAGTYKPAGWFEAGFSYSFVHSKLNTFGLALNIVPAKGANLFLASDYIIPHWNSDFYPTTSKALNFQLGITFPLGNKRTNVKKVKDESPQALNNPDK